MALTPNRRLLLFGALIAALAAPAPAFAHKVGARRPVAVDFIVRVDHEPRGVRVDVVDGGRWLSLKVDRSRRTVVVRGALGEPMLRFNGNGVWANRNSVTAVADRIVRPGGGWERVTPARAFRWHDHRVASPRGLRPGERSTRPLQLTVDGHSESASITFIRVVGPRVWPWLAGTAVLLGALAAFGRRYPRHRARTAAAVALVAASGAVVIAVSFSLWVETVMAVLLVAGALRAWLRPRHRGIIAGVVGGIALAIGLGSIGVFLHGVVLASLPAWLVRLATATAFAGGAVAAVLGVASSEPRTEEVPSVRRDVLTKL